jgi:hypothetical protein
LAPCWEGSRCCRCRTGSEPGETENRALRSHPVRRSVSGEAGWMRETDEATQQNGSARRDRHPTVARAM